MSQNPVKEAYAKLLICIFGQMPNEFPFQSLIKELDFPEYKLARNPDGENSICFQVRTDCVTLQRSRRFSIEYNGSAKTGNLWRITADYERPNQCAAILVTHIECCYTELNFYMDVYYERGGGKWRWRIETPVGEFYEAQTIILDSPPHGIVQEIINFINIAELRLGVE